MKTSLEKALLTVSTLALCLIAIQLIPVSRKADHQIICAESQKRGRKVLRNRLGLNKKDVDPYSYCNFLSKV